MNARYLPAKSLTFDGINLSRGFWRFIMRHRSAALNLSLLVALISCNDAALTAPGSQPVSTSECTIGVDCQATTAGYPPIPAVEIELLNLINAERASQEPPRPALERDLGVDEVE